MATYIHTYIHMLIIHDCDCFSNKCITKHTQHTLTYITYTYLIIYWEREGPSGHPIETIWTGAWNCLLLVVNISWIEGGLFDPIYWEYSVNRGLDFAVVRENFLLEGDSFPLTRVSRKCLCLRVRTTLFGPSYRRMTDH